MPPTARSAFICYLIWCCNVKKHAQENKTTWFWQKKYYHRPTTCSTDFKRKPKLPEQCDSILKTDWKTHLLMRSITYVNGITLSTKKEMGCQGQPLTCDKSFGNTLSPGSLQIARRETGGLRAWWRWCQNSCVTLCSEYDTVGPQRRASKAHHVSSFHTQPWIAFIRDNLVCKMAAVSHALNKAIIGWTFSWLIT